MTSVPEIEISEAQKLLEAGTVTFVDIRDPSSFQAGHVPGARAVHDANVDSFVAEANKSEPVIVYCYHGKSSKGAVAHFLEKGFTDAKSLTGGFEGWREANAPVEKAKPASGSSTLTISELAATKLREYLAEEEGETAVRILLEPTGAFGLSLDTSGPGDILLDVEGLTFAIEAQVAPAVRGLVIDFVDKATGGGFSLSGGSAPKRAGKAEMLDDVKRLVGENKIMMFIKGTAQQPMCGFSARTVQALSALGKPFGHKNVLEVPEYRYAVSEHSSWPTIPQVFIDGKFVGGCDIVLEMSQSGELQKLVEEAFGS